MKLRMNEVEVEPQVKSQKRKSVVSGHEETGTVHITIHNIQNRQRYRQESGELWAEDETTPYLRLVSPPYRFSDWPRVDKFPDDCGWMGRVSSSIQSRGSTCFIPLFDWTSAA